MLNQKQFGCLKFLSVNFNDTQVCKDETSKKTTIHNLKLPVRCVPLDVKTKWVPHFTNHFDTESASCITLIYC